MIYNQYPYPMFNQPYFVQQQDLCTQQQGWHRQQEMLAQQEWREQQERIAKAAHALSDFFREASQIKEPYRPQATVEFMTVLGWNAMGGAR